ncbi:MAG: hypothetical protein O8C66_14460 [Candidatus Methanoperedens sp.]|nr:hypothetical protein [Candidatus Methanoperedens sp.]MCZ7371703.1 hypothetical protein [Candidatus Methanoperedens sp.]
MLYLTDFGWILDWKEVITPNVHVTLKIRLKPWVIGDDCAARIGN